MAPVYGDLPKHRKRNQERAMFDSSLALVDLPFFAIRFNVFGGEAPCCPIAKVRLSLSLCLTHVS